MNEIIRRIDGAINTQEIRIARLEGLIGKGTDDMYLSDKINYHLGVLSGLRHARLITLNELEVV